MSLKVKALGLSLLTAMAVSTVAVMNASANGSGHFVSEVSHTELEKIVGAGHQTHMTNHGLSGEIGCSIIALLSGTMSAQTVTSITGSVGSEGCTTTGTETVVNVTMNGCTGTATVAAGTTNSTEQTGHLVCPVGQRIEVHHPNCTISVHPQTINTGITYTATVENGKHAVTVDTNIAVATTREGLCQFVAPTNGTATVQGSATIRGFDTLGNQVSVTAT